MNESRNGSKGNLLVVSYQYPPLVSAGVYRVAAFARRLHLSGWSTTVLTVKESPYEMSDESSLELVDPGLDVVRTRTLDPPWMLRRSSSTTEAAAMGPARRIARKAAAFLSIVHKRLFGIPDPKSTWGLPLILSAWRILRKGRYVVLSSSPPHSSQLALAVLRRFVKFKWVADFRDPWTAPDRHNRSASLFRTERWMEQVVLKSCDRILANTEGNKRALLETFEFLREEKIEVVTNGFDDSIAVGEPPPEGMDEYDMLYFGELYPGMVDPMLDALDALERKRSPHIPRIAVYGWMTEDDMETIRRRGHENRIEYRGALSYVQSIAAMSRARSLLLLLWHEGDHARTVPSKLYPYLFAGPPVIAIAPDGDATKIVESTGVGVTLTESDPEEMAGRLEDVVAKLRSGDLHTARREDEIRKFTIESLSERVGGILTEEAQP
jgi:hypothetical protein